MERLVHTAISHIILMVNKLQGKVVRLDVPRASIHEAVRCLTDKFCEALETRDWMWSRDRSVHNLQGCFTGTGATVWLQQCTQWSNHAGYGQNRVPNREKHIKTYAWFSGHTYLFPCGVKTEQIVKGHEISWMSSPFRPSKVLAKMGRLFIYTHTTCNHFHIWLSLSGGISRKLSHVSRFC